MIETKYGKIEGTKIGNCDVYKGVPYANPPVGALRFAKPVEVEPWEGVYDATFYRNKSMQGPTRPGLYKKEFYDNKDFETAPSEDSLYLNIWVPKHREGEKLPVAVYVHGGAFMGGAGSNLPFVCNRIAEKGVIIVTINYRLGVFGFLCHPVLAVENENEAGGNYGLWDQLAALRWVKENIGDFGGDASNITAFGQSAGAMSLQTLAVSKMTEGLVNRMILQSGGGYQNPLAAYNSMEKASSVAEDVFEALGLDCRGWKEEQGVREKIRNRLLTASSEELLEAAGAAIGKSFANQRGLPFIPAIDGELLLEDGNTRIEHGDFLDIPYILGANGNDLTTEGENAPSQDNNLMNKGNMEYARIVNERKQSNAYVYYFDRKLPGDDAGAFHSAELWYVFGSLEYCWRPLTERDRELSDEMITYWTNFMKSGNPNEPEALGTKWEPCTTQAPNVKTFDI